MVRIKSPRPHLDEYTSCVSCKNEKGVFFSCVHLNYPTTGEFIFSYYISVAIIKDKLRDLYNLLNHLTTHRTTFSSTWWKYNLRTQPHAPVPPPLMRLLSYIHIALQTAKIYPKKCVFRVGLVCIERIHDIPKRNRSF